MTGSSSKSEFGVVYSVKKLVENEEIFSVLNGRKKTHIPKLSNNKVMFTGL